MEHTENMVGLHITIDTAKVNVTSIYVTVKSVMTTSSDVNYTKNYGNFSPENYITQVAQFLRQY